MKKWKMRPLPFRLRMAARNKEGAPTPNPIGRVDPFTLFLGVAVGIAIIAIASTLHGQGIPKPTPFDLVQSVQRAVIPARAIASNADFQTAKPSSKPTPLPHDGEKLIALTFEDGPHATVTERILDALEKNDAVATFFVVGKRVELLPDIVQDAASRGHEIGNQGYNNKNFAQMSVKAARKDLQTTSKLIEETCKQAPAVIRPPEGAIDDDLAVKLGEQFVLWTADSEDAVSRDPRAVVDTVMGTVGDRAIIRLHDVYRSSADAVELLLPRLKREGYRFVTVSELLALERADGKTVKRIYPTP